MDEEFKIELIEEINKLNDRGKSKDDDSGDEETWGSVEEIWGSAVKISRMKFNIDAVKIMAGDSLQLEFDMSSEQVISESYLQALKNEISEQTDYSLGEIDINLK